MTLPLLGAGLTGVGSAVSNLVFVGDSITHGLGVSAGQDFSSKVASNLGASWGVTNLGVDGKTVADMATDAPSNVDPLYNAAKANNVVVLMGGINDLYNGISAATTYNSIVTFCQDRQSVGWRVGVCTILPASSGGSLTYAKIATVNASIRTNWQTFADVLIDTQADIDIGYMGADLDTTYYQADKVHPTATGHTNISNIVTPFITSDFSSTALGLLSGLVSYWGLEETSGIATRHDLVGGYHLGQTGTPSRAAAKLGQGLSCVAASNQAVFLANPPNLNITGSFTLACWASLTSKTTFRIVQAKGDLNAASTYSYALFYSSVADRWVASISDGTTLHGANADVLGSPSTGTLYFVCMRHVNGDGIYISVNNGTETRTAHTTGAKSDTSTFVIGSDVRVTALPHDGLVDDLAIWSRALSAAELTYLYNSGSGRRYPFAA